MDWWKAQRAIISSQSSRVKRQRSVNRGQGAKQFPHLRGAYISLFQNTLKNYSVTHTKILQPFLLSPRANLNFMKLFLIFKSEEFKKLLLSTTLKKHQSLTLTDPCFSCPSKTDFQIKAVTWSIQQGSLGHRNKY